MVNALAKHDTVAGESQVWHEEGATTGEKIHVVWLFIDDFKNGSECGKLIHPLNNQLQTCIALLELYFDHLKTVTPYSFTAWKITRIPVWA